MFRSEKFEVSFATKRDPPLDLQAAFAAAKDFGCRNNVARVELNQGAAKVACDELGLTCTSGRRMAGGMSVVDHTLSGSHTVVFPAGHASACMHCLGVLCSKIINITE